MGNEEEVVNVLKKGNLLDLQVVDTAKMSYSDQLKVCLCLYVLCNVSYIWVLDEWKLGTMQVYHIINLILC